MNRLTPYAIAAAMILSWSAAAEAWMRMHYEDAAVVDRSEAIVVGHLDKDSIKYVPHESRNGGGASWEYHATLVVSETLKGVIKDKQIAVVINYGLDPLVGGVGVRPDKSLYPGSAPSDKDAGDRIDIVDTGNSSWGGPPALENAQKDNLWFLRHLGGDLGREAGKGEWGIVDPEDVGPLKFKDYFKALLSDDVEKGIDRLLTAPDEDVSLRAMRFLAARHSPKDAPRLVKLLTAASPTVQAAAAEALAEVADLSAVPTFREALKSPNAGVRLTACGFLCRFRDTESIAAIGKLLPAFDSAQRAALITNLPRMESREVVDLLLDQLDEHLDPGPNPMYAYSASIAAAKALRSLTGAEFPLDATEARRIWDRLKVFPDEVLLRKALLEDMEALKRNEDSPAAGDARERMGRLANQDHEPIGITRQRVEWLYDGFADSGIVLPRPMDANGIDTLIDVLQFYGNGGRDQVPPSHPAWSTRGGWPMAQVHEYNADFLLERLTGYKVGLSPYYNDLKTYDGKVGAARWAAWWKENRGKTSIRDLPREKAVTIEMISKVPSLRLSPPSLALTIRAAKETHVYKGKDPLTVLVEIKNVSAQDVLIERRPYTLDYTSKTGSGGRGGGGRAGRVQEDFVTLKPSEAITWEQADTPSVDNVTPPMSIEALRYKLTYSFAGSQFGLRAWRGKLVSNEISVKVQTQE